METEEKDSLFGKIFFTIIIGILIVFFIFTIYFALNKSPGNRSLDNFCRENGYDNGSLSMIESYCYKIINQTYYKKNIVIDLNKDLEDRYYFIEVGK